MAIVDGKIRCPDCETYKPLSEFQPSAIERGCGYCKACKYARKEEARRNDPAKHNEAKRVRRERNKDAYISARRAWNASNRDKVHGYNVKKAYGITRDEYERILAQQGGRCACCGRESNTCGRKLFVDHCHETGRIRGIICNRCNYGIGALGDNIEGVRRALEYLKGA